MIRYQAHKEDNFKILLSIKRANHSNHFNQRDQDKTNKMFLKIAISFVFFSQVFAELSKEWDWRTKGAILPVPDRVRIINS